VNFDSYTDCGVLLAVELVNTAMPDAAALRALLERLDFSAIGPIDRRTVTDVQALRLHLRAVFNADDDAQAAARVNELLVESRALPQLTDHDGEAWHLHYTPPDARLEDRIKAEAAMGLAGVLRAGGFDRMSVCADPTCGDVFVDASRNRSRRFCNPDTCGNRANVAAYRARQRLTVG
jgi:predicted RNA-binding Zn ribbon-like protein